MDLHILYFLSELDIPVVCFPVAINDDDVGADNVLSHCFAADQQLGTGGDRDPNLYELSSDQDPMALLGLRIGKDPADLKGSGITGELVVVVVDVSLVGIFLLIHSQSQFDRNLFRFDRRTLSFADRFFDLFDRMFIHIKVRVHRVRRNNCCEQGRLFVATGDQIANGD